MRSPLGLIKGTVEVLLMQSSTPEMTVALEIIRNQALVSLDLVDNMLCQSKIQQKCLSLLPRQNELSELSLQIDSQLNLICESAGIQVITHFSENAGNSEQVWNGDESYLLLAIRNLARHLCSLSQDKQIEFHLNVSGAKLELLFLSDCDSKQLLNPPEKKGFTPAEPGLAQDLVSQLGGSFTKTIADKKSTLTVILPGVLSAVQPSKLQTTANKSSVPLQTLIWILDPSQEQSSFLEPFLMSEGFEVRVFNSLSELSKEKSKPGIFVVNLKSEEEHKTFKASPQNAVPTVFLKNPVQADQVLEQIRAAFSKTPKERRSA